MGYDISCNCADILQQDGAFVLLLLPSTAPALKLPLSSVTSLGTPPSSSLQLTPTTEADSEPICPSPDKDSSFPSFLALKVNFFPDSFVTVAFSLGVSGDAFCSETGLCSKSSTTR
uniref:Uncharacterized protein n=1 Tax=Opuntia streptacantha TaxID=393608 RepID=A0A7C9CJM8_OPUST